MRHSAFGAEKIHGKLQKQYFHEIFCRIDDGEFPAVLGILCQQLNISDFIGIQNVKTGMLLNIALKRRKYFRPECIS